MSAFVELGLVSSIPSGMIDWKESLQSDLFLSLKLTSVNHLRVLCWCVQNIHFRQRDPAVHRAMTHYGCPWPLIATRWFICLYVDVVPTEVFIAVFHDCRDGGGGHWLVRMEWRPPTGLLVCLLLLIFLCAINSRSSLLAPAHPGGPGKRAVKRLWCGGFTAYCFVMFGLE